MAARLTSNWPASAWDSPSELIAVRAQLSAACRVARKISKPTNGLVGKSRTGRTSSIKRRHRQLSRMWRMRKIRAASSKCRGPNAAQRAFEFDARLSRCAHARPRSSLSAGSTRTQQEVVGSLLTLATRSSSLTSSKTSSAHPARQRTCRRAACSRLSVRARFGLVPRDGRPGYPHDYPAIVSVKVYCSVCRNVPRRFPRRVHRRFRVPHTGWRGIATDAHAWLGLRTLIGY